MCVTCSATHNHRTLGTCDVYDNFVSLWDAAAQAARRRDADMQHGSGAAAQAALVHSVLPLSAGFLGAGLAGRHVAGTLFLARALGRLCRRRGLRSSRRRAIRGCISRRGSRSSSGGGDGSCARRQGLRAVGAHGRRAEGGRAEKLGLGHITGKELAAQIGIVLKPDAKQQALAHGVTERNAARTYGQLSLSHDATMNSRQSDVRSWL
jgi:hypothetical protein